MWASNCPSNAELTAYSIGTLSTDRIELLAAHLDACDACQQRLAFLDEAGDDLIDELRGSAITVADTDVEELNRLMRIAEHAPLSLADTRVSGSSGRPNASHTLEVQRERRIRQRPFRFLGKLGSGGMGVVYKMHHVPLDRAVAVKLLRHDRRWDQRDVARFEREIRAIGQLDHVNLVRATDAGRFHGRHYLVMEYIDGIDLGQYLNTHGPLPIAEACEVIRQAALGLQHAFENGIIHRDIKPSNLMVSRSGTVKVLDLGLAVLKTDSPRRGDGAGTAQFMAPEQKSRQSLVDSRVDIYSLGATLNALLGDPVRQTDESLNLEDSRSSTSSGIRIPTKLATFIARMLSPTPASRPKAPAEVAAALEPFARGANLLSLVSAEVPIIPRRRIRYAVPLTGLALLTTLAVILLAWSPWKDSSPKPALPKSTAVPALSPPTAPEIATTPFSASEAEHHQQRWAEWLRVPVFETNSLGMPLVLIPPGRYLRGSPPEETSEAATFSELRGLHDRQQHGFENEGPQHPVSLPQPFYLGMHEVTQEEFSKVMGVNPSEFQPGSTQEAAVQDIDTKLLPVEHLTWTEAVDYCLKLSALPEERAAGRFYRLPTEAEWEFACRAGSETSRCFGGLSDDLEPHAWFIDNANGRPHRVGQKAANPFGLHDMYGNVWEWCSDWQGRYPKTAELLTNPTGRSRGERRILRGGSWRHHASFCRSAERLGMTPHYRNIAAGFRVLCEISPTRSK